MVNVNSLVALIMLFIGASFIIASALIKNVGIKANLMERGISKQIEDTHAQVSDAIKNTKSQTVDAISDIRKEVHSQVKNIYDEIVTAVNDTYDKTLEGLQQMHKEMADTARQVTDIIGKFGAIRATYIKNGLNDDPGYIQSLKMIEQAMRRIWIIGDFSPSWLSLNPPRERVQYLKAIESKVKQAIVDRTVTDFSYRRIIQRDLEIVRNVRDDRKGLLNEDDMTGDKQVYEHCYAVQRIKVEHGHHNDNVEVSIRLSRQIPNSPSILLVDDTCMLFTIPSTRRREVSLEQITDGVLFFEFLEGGKQIARYFESIFNQIYDCTDPVTIRLQK